MSNQFIISNIAKDLELNVLSVKNTIELFEDGATIPFIARYRKEKTHGLDETVIRSISEKLEYYNELEKRKVTILKIEGKKHILADKRLKKIISVHGKCWDRTRLPLFLSQALEPLLIKRQNVQNMRAIG